MKWIEIERPAPILNTPNFSNVFGGADGKTLPLDQDGHPHPYEFVALPGMSFQIVKELNDHIIQISCPHYSSIPLYTDKRFGKLAHSEPPIFRPIPPSIDTVLERMEQRIGTPYVWGGNWAEGIPELLDWYPPQKPLDPRIKTLWTFQGLDCSGLLFEATGGITPRNSSQLTLYGNPIALNNLRPLDMIVYPGHVLFVRDSDTIIESKSPFGVRIYPMQERLRELLSERSFVTEWSSKTNSSHSFIVRRINALE